jgi:carbon monoxide dehydrogenase subunit G
MSNLKFGGEESFDSPPEKVFTALTDLDQLAASIPDLTSSQKVDDQTLDCVVRPGFSFLRGTMRLRIVVSDLVAPETATMQIDARGIGATMQVVSHLQLAAQGAGTRLLWSAEILKLTGLVATVSSSLVTAAADQVIRQGWSDVRKRLGER